MHLNRSFELDYLTLRDKNSAGDLLLGMTPKVYNWLRERSPCNMFSSFKDKQDEKEEIGWFPFPMNNLLAENSLSILSQIFELLREIPDEYRAPRPQLIAPEVVFGDDTITVGGNVSKELFEWVLENLEQNGETSKALRKKSSIAWNNLSEFPDSLNADAFDCHALNGVIHLGRAGGNVGASIANEGDRFSVIPHNINSSRMACLIVQQLAMIEGEYRRSVEQ